MHRSVLLLLPLLTVVHSQNTHAAWVATAAGESHTCAIDEGGKVSCWGANYSGQLGLGAGQPGIHDTPMIVPGLSDVKALAAGAAHTCVIVKQDGSVRCWGENAVGQLGLGTTNGASSPMLVTGLVGVVAIAAGDRHTCAATASGATYCWGRNDKGQLGLDDTNDRLAPAIVSSLATMGIQGLTAGYRHTCAVTSQGGALCWGYNGNGQLGVGDYLDRKVPTNVAGLAAGSGVTVVNAGSYYTCAIKTGGRLVCWGSQLTSNSNIPQQVLWDGVARVAAGAFHACAVLGDRLYCWGWNEDGQLGVGDNEDRLAPTLVDGSYASALGLAAGYRHTCLVKASGDLSCWGENGSGQLGLDLPAYRSRPASVSAFSVVGTAGATAISVGASHTCALVDGGGAACWGRNGWGELGLGDHTAHASPAAVPSLQKPVALAAGTWFSCAIEQSGGVECWGANGGGQLGNGGLLEATSPGAVVGIADASAVDVGTYHACAVHAGGKVACWGVNSDGRLGRGTITSSEPLAADIQNFDAASKLAVGNGHTCALTTAANVFCWGANDQGQLGIGTTADQSSPAEVAGLANVVSIAAGIRHTCAVRSDGTVWCWGYNGHGELGLGTFYGEHWVPAQVPGLSNAVQVAAGNWHTCAVKADGSVVCWGSNFKGQLGQDNPADQATPVLVPGATSAVAVSAGGLSTCALNSDRSVMCWGNNYDGQLGSGTFGYTRRPRGIDHILEDGFDSMEIP